MKTPKLEKSEVAKWLNALSDHDFISFFYTELHDRHVYRAERRYVDAHLVLSVARRDREDDGTCGQWRTELLSPTPGQVWVKDASICQFGSCTGCGRETASWSPSSQCPVCGALARGT